VPFAFDVTGSVRPGGRARLVLDVTGRRLAPIVDRAGKPLWPIGQPSQPELDGRFAGIVDDVFLRAYGICHIEDAFLRPSWRERCLVVDYTLVNAGDSDETVRLEAEAGLESAGQVEQRWKGPEVRLAAGERRVAQARYDWPSPRPWWPDDPALYTLRSRLFAGGREVDSEQRRLGFREIWIEGNQYVLNGVRLNLWGDYTLYGQERYWPGEHGPEVFAETVRKLQKLNVRILRWHKQPPPQFTFDVTDSLGLLVCAESAINGAEGNALWAGMDRPAFKRNALRWIGPWVKGSRNHPSLVIWSAENEFGAFHQRVFSDRETLGLGEEIARHDPTRPVCFEGDQEVGGRTINYHYPEGFDKVPEGSIYSWASLVYPDKPTGAGEILHVGAELEPTPERERIYDGNKWALGLWLRGMRYVGFTDFRPAIYRWARKELSSPRVEAIRNAYAPVALFDKEYDDLDRSALADGRCPVLTAGGRVERTLLLYNDEFRDTGVQARVALRADGRLLAEAAISVEVPLGGRVEIPCRFTVPGGCSRLEMVLAAAKGGSERFREARAFDVQGRDEAGDCALDLG
jgi:beta-galactosidase